MGSWRIGRQGGDRAEEDAADRFATLMLLREGPSGEAKLRTAAEAYELAAAEGPALRGDEHAPPEARAAAHLCLLYGAGYARRPGWWAAVPPSSSGSRPAPAASGVAGRAFAEFVKGGWSIRSTLPGPDGGRKDTGRAAVREDGTWTIVWSGVAGTWTGRWSLHRGRLDLRVLTGPRPLTDPYDGTDLRIRHMDLSGAMSVHVCTRA
ncbi:DUF4344 domain-containing metallopeptidase [Streptomyces sp. NPDC006326]|uniref:DUF4344 domain-containing metallopeptidase n=1 Tax=Streptomyces sp. NPDC006326 TaxID=3156752 RepID=UPI00339F3F97